MKDLSYEDRIQTSSSVKRFHLLSTVFKEVMVFKQLNRVDIFDQYWEIHKESPTDSKEQTRVYSE